LRGIAYDRAAIRIKVIVTEVRVVMLVIRLELFLGGALLGALSEDVSCNETGDRASSKQDAKGSHDFSPCRPSA
jgi:hypothetical protein